MIGTVLDTYNSPGPASGLRYKVRLNMPGGSTRVVDDARSAFAVPPDADTYDWIGSQMPSDFFWDFVGDGDGDRTVIRMFIPCFPDSIDCEDL